jgi:hypothetical protein
MECMEEAIYTLEIQIIPTKIEELPIEYPEWEILKNICKNKIKYTYELSYANKKIMTWNNFENNTQHNDK